MFLAASSVMGAGFNWEFYSARSTLAPIYEQKEDERLGIQLILAGNGKTSVNGAWRSTIQVPASEFVRFSAEALFTRIEEPNRSIVTNLVWLNEKGNKIGSTEFPRARILAEKESISFEQVYRVPPEASAVRIDLIFRWDADGKVIFQNIFLEKSEEIEARTVKLAAIHHRPQNTTKQTNLAAFAKLAAQAGEQGADIVCLPEGITLVGTGNNYLQSSESIPGPSTKLLGEVASAHQMYIIAGLLEKDGEEVYNTAVLINREGQVQGKYRKVSLPREEIEGGITPGDSFPVFTTDFGRIGMMICWDVTYPEAARELARKGAEVIFLPIWGGNLTLAKARAIENQVYLVSSTYDMKTGIFDLEGELLAEGTDSSPIAIAEVDLNAQKLWPWLGEFKNRIWQEMPSKTALQK